jgi:hypothetical protein
LFPIIINQNNVVLDGHHRLRACKELGIQISYETRDFTDKPLEELKFVVSSNLNRRHLDEFQKVHVAIKYDKLYRKIALERHRATHFGSEEASKAASKKHKQEQEEFTSSLRSASGDAHRSLPEESSIPESEVVERKSSAELAQQFGISQSTVESSHYHGPWDTRTD